MSDTPNDEWAAMWDKVKTAEARIKELEQRLAVEEAHSEKYMAENQRLREALTTVREWKLPRVKDRHGMETSYEWEYGSNGVRDYMKTIANVALLGGGENG